MTEHAHPILAAALGDGWTLLGGVVVQRFSLDQAARLVPDLSDLVTKEEAERAKRLLSPVQQRRATASRAILRTILGDLADRRPANLVFETGPHGKPRLAGGGLRFSVSHSADRLVVATSFLFELGIDVELPAIERAVDSAARFALNADDLAALDRLPSDRRKHGFLRLWTTKEATLKAIGVGMHRAMREVAIDPAGLATLGEPLVWRPQRATIDGKTIEICDASIDSDVACLAVLP